MTRIRITCPNCASTNVTSDATVAWNESGQYWKVTGLLDSADCHECGAELDKLTETDMDTDAPAPATYTAYRLAPCLWTLSKGGVWHITQCESEAEATRLMADDDGSHSIKWSLYGVLPDGDIECIGDWISETAARDAAYRISGDRAWLRVQSGTLRQEIEITR